MQTFTNIIDINAKSCVALGFFDGMHTGHQKLILETTKKTDENLIPTVFTFFSKPNPLQKNILTTEEKSNIFADLGIENLFLIDFESIKNLTPEDFFEQILIKKLHSKKIICGFNFRFGKNASGNTSILEKLCKKHNCELIVVPAVTSDDKIISSSSIKSLIAEGNVYEANKLLFSPYGLSGEVIKGNQIGRTIGAPTLNLKPSENLILPKFGVYAGLVKLNNVVYPAVTNIGTKPTVGSKAPLFEAWIPNYCGEEFYGETADLRLYKFIRDEKKYSSLQDLQAAIQKDKISVLDFLNL